MKHAKTKIGAAVVLSLILIMMTIPSFAIEHDIPFSFHLQLNHENSYLSDSSARYRETTNVSNTWKVQVSEQLHDSDQVANYWIAKKTSHAQVADDHRVKAKTGPHYYNARTTASKQWVVLAADNNNNVTSSVSGFWDEETN